MKLPIKTLIVLLVIAACAWFYFHSGSTDDKKGKKDQVTQVAFMAAHKGDIDIFVNALGGVTPHNTVTVHSRVDGELLRVYFKEGQLVKEGDLLAELDARTYEAQLKQTQGQLMRDQASLQEAKQTLERYKILLAKDSIPQQTLDTQASIAKQFEGAVKNDEGLIDNATTLLDYTRITAPISGRVGLRPVDPGNIVHSADASGIVVITEIDPISVIFTVPEDRIPALTERMKQPEPLEVEAWNRENNSKLATGILTAIDNQVDTTTGTLKIRSDFGNGDGALFPNQFVNVRLKIGTKRDALIISAAAVQRGAKGSFVYRIKDDNTVEAAPITTSIMEGDSVAVESGLKEGDKVVTEGGDSLREGAKVSTSDKADKGKESDKTDAKTDDATKTDDPNAKHSGKHHKKQE